MDYCRHLLFSCYGAGSRKAPDLMDEPPGSSEVGIFTWEDCIDTSAYGIIMTGSYMASFTGSLYGINSGRLAMIVMAPITAVVVML